MFRPVRNIINKNKMLKNVAFRFYSLYEEKKAKDNFYSRIKNINNIIYKYVDTSNKPDLNVIILVIDCLRYSNLSFTGYPRKTTSFLDSLKVKFRAVSTAPWTYPSVASILTGLHPHNHGAYIYGKLKNFDSFKRFKPIRSSILTLPEILFTFDYDIYFSAAIEVAIYSMRNRVIYKRYQSDTPAEKLLNDLKKWILKRKRPFFAYLHLGDIHEPLVPPNKFRNYFGKVKNIPNLERWDFRRPEEQKGKEFNEYMINRMLLYDNTLKYIDYAIEQFYSFLEDSGLLDTTILVITADHGEEFWEHAKLEAENFYDPRGYYGVGHGHNVFNEIIEVPILLDGAVKSHGDYVKNRVSSADITPTILNLLGVSHNLTFDGQDLFKVKNKKRPLLSEAVGYGYEKKALILGRYKLIYSPDDNVQWLFDLKKDPYEQHPIKDEEVTSIFVDKLNKMLREDERKKLAETLRGLKI
ncbi:sulfatase [Pyrococcus sp. ST04]|uniref:sulfatase n=1 Tax=Pyrococcus sp. ST04 TaxID=1183377 RepID=UPI0002605A81|nr:sulfatase [Pyrococcus sp. ST04]AFK22066.1 hypothetical protein Py04_0464 [Pyrococcus sp. ST04]